MDHGNTASALGHGASLAIIAGTLLGWLPALAALAAFLWYCTQIYDWVQKKRDEE